MQHLAGTGVSGVRGKARHHCGSDLLIEAGDSFGEVHRLALEADDRFW